jgi:hypothetical protein
MSVQAIYSELIEELTTDQQQFISGGNKLWKDDQDPDDDYEDKDKEKEYRKIPVAFKGYFFLPESTK